MRKIPYYDLQKKYAGKVVILNNAGTRVLATGKTGPQILTQIKQKGLEKIKFMFQGPITRAGAVNVYFSLRHQTNKRG